jgi:hypothetical protein
VSEVKNDVNPDGRAVRGAGLRLLACLDCGFKSHQGHGGLSAVSVVFSGIGLCNGLIAHPEELYRV